MLIERDSTDEVMLDCRVLLFPIMHEDCLGVFARFSPKLGTTAYSQQQIGSFDGYQWRRA